MSVYTNDVDTLRQMISQSIPQLVSSAITIVSVFTSMCLMSWQLTVVTMLMVALMSAQFLLKLKVSSLL